MNTYALAVQITDGNVNDILRLPYVVAVRKCNNQSPSEYMEWLEYDLTDGHIAEQGDWLCLDHQGRCHVLSKDEYSQSELSKPKS